MKVLAKVFTTVLVLIKCNNFFTVEVHSLRGKLLRQKLCRGMKKKISIYKNLCINHKKKKKKKKQIEKEKKIKEIYRLTETSTLLLLHIVQHELKLEVLA